MNVWKVHDIDSWLTTPKDPFYCWSSPSCRNTVFQNQMHLFIHLKFILYPSNVTAHVSYSGRLPNSIYLIPPKAQKLQASYHACRLTDDTLDAQVQRFASKETNSSGYWPPPGQANLVPPRTAASNSRHCIITWRIYLILHSRPHSPREHQV